MKIQERRYATDMPVPAEELFAWHSRPGALPRLLPPWQSVRVESTTGGIRDGDRVVLSAGLGPARLRMAVEHFGYRDGEQFCDRQTSGPFAFWEQTHAVEPVDEHRSRLVDTIRYALPGGPLAKLGRSKADVEIDRMFAFRHCRTRQDLAVHERHSLSPQRVLISGATGLVGSALTNFLTTGGHEIHALTRHRRRDDDVEWSIPDRRIQADRLEGLDAVVHLAGESIIGRWTDAKKRRIRDSRVEGTRFLCETLAKAERPPRVLVCASAIGIYGDRGDETLTEASQPGSGFLADVCQEWEAACEPARAAGIRVVNLRVGLVLSPRGGLLGTLLRLFRTGLGGRVGDGKQWMSWVVLDDLTDAIFAAIADDRLAGPVNGTALRPVRNRDFSTTLARVLHRPAFVPAPAFGVKLALGREAAEETALVSTMAVPMALEKISHPFRFSELDDALRFMLGSNRKIPSDFAHR